jgi:ribosomal subunit interface protein
MNITVTARHQDFTETLKDYARQKAHKLEHYFDHLRKLEVILDRDGAKRYSAELIASAVRGNILVCHSSDLTAMAALDSVVDKMEIQLTKFKEKLNGKHKPKASKVSRRRPEPVAGDSFADIWW